MDTGTLIVVILIVLIVVVITVPIVILQQKRQARASTDLAARLGLSLRPRSNSLSPIVIEGEHQGHPVEIDTYSTQHDENTQTYTRIVMSVDNPCGMALELSKHGALDKVARTLGVTGIETGDPEVDQQLKIKGQPEEAIRGLVKSGSVRQRLLAEPRLDVRLNRGELVWRTPGAQRDPDRLRAALDLLSALAVEVAQAKG